MILLVVLTLITGAMSCAAWLIVSLKRLKVSDARTEQALRNCPAKDRPAVLEAAGKYASSLNGDRRQNPLVRMLRNPRPGAAGQIEQQ
jgi:hypothetical protein